MAGCLALRISEHKAESLAEPDIMTAPKAKPIAATARRLEPMTHRSLLLSCLMFLLAASFVPSARAADHYVWCGANGDGSGSNWTNAMRNFGAVSGKAALVRGDTYYVAGSTSCSYGASGLEFTTPASGAEYITVTKCTSSISECTSAAGWQSSFGAANAQFNDTAGGNYIQLDAGYYIFNGSSCATPGSPGTAGIASSCGFYMQTDANIQPNDFFKVGPGTGATLSNVTVEYFGFDGVNCCDISSTVPGYDFIWQHGDNVSNLTIAHDVFTNSKQDFVTVSTFSGVTITDNYFDTNRYTSSQHSSVVAMNPSGGGATCSSLISSDFTFAHNIVRNGTGTSLLTVLNGTLTNASIYGNVFFHPNGGGGGRGTFSGNGSSSCVRGNVYFLNNTITGSVNANIEGIYPLYNGNPTALYVEDNLLWNTGAMVFPSGAGVTDGYNTYLNVANNAGGYTPTRTDYWTKSGSANPFVGAATGDYRLSSETVDPHLNDGVSTSSTFAPNSTDPLGSVRGQDGTWERGAYEFVGGSSQPDPPASLVVSSIH